MSLRSNLSFAVPYLCLCAALQGATGAPNPQLSAFDDLIEALLAKWRIPGAALGVSHNGRLVLARGYGIAPGEAAEAVQPESLFPIGDISRAIETAAALQPLGITGMQVAPSGGWIASVADLLRLANALDGRRPPALLKPSGDAADWWTFGNLPDSTACLFHQAGTGVDVALFFNAAPPDRAGFHADISAGIVRAASSIHQWPSTDLFFDGPELFARDVVNSADYSSGPVSPGEIVVLYPSNAGPVELAGSQLNAAQRIATLTGETRVLFDGIPAPMASAVNGRIGAVVPYGIAGHPTTQVVVEYHGVRSPPVTLPVVESAPAVFTLDASGKGQAAMLNETGCCNSVRNPAARGAVAALYATGEGQTVPAGIDGDLNGDDRVAHLPKPLLPVSVTVGGIPAEISYAGEAPHAVAGLLQVNFRVPLNAPLGDAVPLVLQAGGSRSPDGVTMAVRSEVQRILILDSDPAVRAQLTQILKAARYEVIPAAEAGQHPIDLVICSLAIPEAERLKTVRAIVSEQTRVRIAALAGVLDSAALRSADLLGAQIVLTKPLVPKTVLQRIRELVRSRPFPYVADEESPPSPGRPN